jgi:membrane-associated phospholipid phosphatase
LKYFSKKISISSFGFVVLFGLSIPLLNGAEIDKKSDTEKTGDALMFLIPSLAYGSTFAFDDEIGRAQFYKSFLSNGVVTTAFKYGIDANRPDGSDNDSFPSAHTSLTFNSATFIHKRYGLKYALPIYAGASFVAWSRVDAKKHYTRDVVAGALFGSLSSYYFTSPFKDLSFVPLVSTSNVGLQVSYRW